MQSARERANPRGGPPIQVRYGRGSTPWHALKDLSLLLHKERDEHTSSARAKKNGIEVRLICVEGIDPNGGWVAEASWELGRDEVS